MPIILSDQSTWPSDVIEFLEVNFESFLGWECNCCENTPVCLYEKAICEMQSILKRHSLIGYHCTRLTESEIKHIRANGLLLQNAASLGKRIACLEESGLLGSDVARCLKNTNQADCPSRANKLWFCFYEPYLAGCGGIRRFFCHWGGEALYNSHEGDRATGKALRNVGVPCIVKAKVPIASLGRNCYPDSTMIKVFLSQREHQIENEKGHEGYSTEEIGSQNIIKIIEHPGDQFITLTKCDEWSLVMQLYNKAS